MEADLLAAAEEVGKTVGHYEFSQRKSASGNPRAQSELHHNNIKTIKSTVAWRS
jgi:hypothetical protein